MKLGEDEIRAIVRGEIKKLMLEQMDSLKQGEDAELMKGKGEIRTMGQQVANTPHLQSDIENAVRQVITSTNIKDNLKKVAENPIAAATFITQLMRQLNLNPTSYAQIMSQISESKEKHIVSVLKNCFKLIKDTRTSK